MYMVVHGYNGCAGAVLAMGRTYNIAQQVALRTHNDEMCDENVTWVQMCAHYASNDQYVLVVRVHD
jgi:hypothetical protein